MELPIGMFGRRPSPWHLVFPELLLTAALRSPYKNSRALTTPGERSV